MKQWTMFKRFQNVSIILTQTLLLTSLFVPSPHCTRTHHQTGIELFEKNKSKLWESQGTEWVKWIVVNGTCRLQSDKARLQFINEFDPDIIDWWYGPDMNPGDFCRRRGIAVSGPAEFEYQEALQFTKEQTKNFFTGNGIALKEDGTEPLYTLYGNSNFVCHNAPRWHQVSQQGMVRLAPYGDCITQDNISSTIGKGWGNFCDWCNKRFTDFMNNRFSPAELSAMGFDSRNFNIRDYLKNKRGQLQPEMLIEDPIIHEYIRFQYIAQINEWIELADATKRTAVKCGKPVPALYGNQWGAQGIWPLGTLLSPHVDVVWIEQALYQPYVNTGEVDIYQPFTADKNSQAWSTLLYKLGRASGNFSRPVWTVLYPQQPLLTSLVLAEARAQGGLMVQYYNMDEKLINSETWNVHQKHAQFAQQNRELFTDRDSKAEVALVYSIPSTVWRTFSSLTVPHTQNWENIQTCEHIQQFTTAARLLEDSHIPYDALIFGHQDFFDETESFARMNRYKTIILPAVDALSDKQTQMLATWIRNGGQLILWGNVGARDEELHLRSQPAFQDFGKNTGQGEIVSIASKEDASVLLQKDDKPLIKTNLPNTVWLNVWQHGAGPMTSVQMVNYNVAVTAQVIHPVKDFTLRIRCTSDKDYTHADFIAPNCEAQSLPLSFSEGYAEVNAPGLDLFGVVVFSVKDELKIRKTASQTRKWFERLKIADRCPGEKKSQGSAIYKEAERLLKKIQCNICDENSSAQNEPLDSLAVRLQAQLNQVTNHVSEFVNRSRTDVMNVSAVFKFDFGEGGSQTGWTKILKNSMYSKTKSFGWTKNQNIKAAPTVPMESPQTYADDYLWSQNPAEFKADLQNGEYVVTIITGDDNKDIRVGTTYVYANGEPALLGNRLMRGYYENRSFRVTVTDNQLILRFYGNNTGPLYANPSSSFRLEEENNGIGWQVNALIIQQSDQPLTESAQVSLNKSTIISKSAIRDWAVIGPFDNSAWDGIEKLFPPEQSTNLTKTYSGKSGQIQWQRYSHQKGNVPVIPLSAIMENTGGSAAYALAHVYCEQSTKAILIASTSQTGAGYVNGECVFRDEVAAGLLPEEEKVPIQFKEGWNTILIKSLNFWGSEWSMWAGLLNEDGKPLENIKVTAAGEQRVEIPSVVYQK